MALFRYPQPRPSEITPKDLYFSRRKVIAGLSAGLGVAALGTDPAQAGEKLHTHPGPYSATLEPTSRSDVTGYNNFYEFGMDKSDPAASSGDFKPLPWTLEIGGLVRNPQRLDVGQMLQSSDMEERIYRMRCVEAWSMVIPWDGIPLATLLKAADPDPKAKFVAFESVERPSEMPGQRNNISGIEWPYVEGLRLDEAMNPLTLLAMGIYGETLPNQNGAPVRLVVPWKYGFKGIKSIQRIRLVEEMPPTTWNRLAPSEYGFYANVNPEVDHPRWSQASERVIGSRSLFGEKRQPTLMFNGYGEQVADLYKRMDLHASY
ncbi:protein-methionine-sulfoxide reductase catalytic subunit MsrP [Gluconobacter wancherniae]|uniref:Protein-methionine-sulfoxide reductase catalytic subunit MsrP n=1 Tax=Gluconobacter wancherniae NBRC 103581 TaxID=656744 RepID=A0A511AZE4_9PROT|nr:protein-methionine-sulfoxide reductase catalytic subunit MsrP [Gluconobacter wancherniae]MBF0852867.1 protein-methionine-sulfoxide reductase catalytic subunit MsrP [Gluconobacter wancherniae]MBS1087754.1 protein-methionine-sulfoxide reductase catalytic subunit MsrP [Gluconobacter wancherniae]MBS1093436.1 protein-methionine-sulfoxide reductase catalytic subunit MsrP [Gluconobacter wancherniae]GBD56417.1 protein-methionine-sulfoxide reductase catalytic subunit MsrP [Gluconobacter wancherniae N